MKKEAVLSIYYTQNGKVSRHPQGKFFYIDDKPIYLADFDSQKPFNNFDGFPIAKQILDSFSKLKLRVKIAYRVKRLGIINFAKPSDFRKHGWVIPFGGHEQYILASKYWDTKQATIDDPKNLPEIVLSDWEKDDRKQVIWHEDGGFSLA